MEQIFTIIGVSALLLCALAGFVVCRAVSLLTRQAGALFIELQRYRELIGYLVRALSTAPRPEPDKATDSDDRQ